MTIRQFQRELSGILSAAGLKEPRHEALLLMAGVLDRPISFFYAHPDDTLDERTTESLRALAVRRTRHEPLAYLIGTADFSGLTFSVGPGVLIPRPDSEILVETSRSIALAHLWPTRKTAGRPLRILDACAGSGCIGISLAHVLEEAGCRTDLVFTDLDPVPLSYIRQNLRRNPLRGRTALYQADLFPPAAAEPEPFDLITANPPYIPSGDIDGLMPEVSCHEPHLALDGGADGLDIYRMLIDRAINRLAADGWLILEHGYDQADAVRAILQEAGYESLLPVIRDFGNQPRVGGGCRSLN
ncbi:MAG: peptide chain release factor N(5)-glutamine methyltransferase [Clostridiaceae bacterium]|nr:peptide chain release factor N(5)-glutamine methyltransferase [Clostridiaceae bacterium]